jgi:hypothetical protein
MRDTSSLMSLPLAASAQLVDLQIEFGDGLFKIEITAHRVRHVANI